MPEEYADPVPDTFVRTYAQTYPEVVRAGSLRDALQAEADRAGYEITMVLTSSPGWRHVAAKVEADGRHASAVMALEERSFAVDCWADGLQMAGGSTDVLSDVAGAMHSWMEGPRVHELAAQWPFLRFSELAEAHERGDAVPVRWRQLRAACATDRRRRLHELVEAAFSEPRLRVLSPGTSVSWLRFSRSATPPLCTDLPAAMPIGNDRYRVRTPDGLLREAQGTAEAIALILSSLPDDVPTPKHGLAPEGRRDSSTR